MLKKTNGIALAIIGHPHIGKTVTQDVLMERIKADHPNQEVLIVDLDEAKKKSYLEFEREAVYLIKSQPVIPVYDPEKKYERALNPSINIHREYNLIKQKKSNLSKWERDEVVRIVEGKEANHG